MSSPSFEEVICGLDIKPDLEAIASTNLSAAKAAFDDPVFAEEFIDAQSDPFFGDLAELAGEIARDIAPGEGNAASAVFRGIQFGTQLFSFLLLPSNPPTLDVVEFYELNAPQRYIEWPARTDTYLRNNPSLASLADLAAVHLAPSNTSQQLTRQAVAFGLMNSYETTV